VPRMTACICVLGFAAFAGCATHTTGPSPKSEMVRVNPAGHDVVLGIVTPSEVEIKSAVAEGEWVVVGVKSGPE